MYNVQVTENLPGIISTNIEHLEKLNFETTKNLSKWQFRRLVAKYISDLNKSELLEDSKKYKKVKYENLVREDFKRSSFLLLFPNWGGGDPNFQTLFFRILVLKIMLFSRSSAPI